MSRDRIYIFSDGWCFGCEYSIGTHGHMGEYREVVVGQGWSIRDLNRMVADYLEENRDSLFESNC